MSGHSVAGLAASHVASCFWIYAPLAFLVAITVALAGKDEPCPGGPPGACCDPWTMATYMTGPEPEVTLPVWNPCDLNCDGAIDLRDVAIGQRWVGAGR